MVALPTANAITLSSPEGPNQHSMNLELNPQLNPNAPNMCTAQGTGGS